MAEQTTFNSSTTGVHDPVEINEHARSSGGSLNVSQTIPESIQDINNPLADVPPAPEELNEMRDQYNNLQSSIEGQITQISEANLGVDVDALVGQIDARFGQVKNQITQSALLSVQKAGLDLDTYFGSAQGDQRAGVRAMMAANVKNSMMATAFRSIGEIYDKNTQSIVSAQLEGAKINTQAAATKAQAIAEFTGLATQAYLGVLSETNKNYANRLNASVQWAQVQAQARGQDLQYAAAMENLNVSMRNADLQASVSERGQDISAETARRGQDIQREISFEQMRSDADRIQLERDKANLQASMMVWKSQGTETQKRWTPTMGGSTKTASDFGSYRQVHMDSMFGGYKRTLFQFNDDSSQYFTAGGGFV